MSKDFVHKNGSLLTSMINIRNGLSLVTLKLFQTCGLAKDIP